MKEYRGFYYDEQDTRIYGDITNKVINMFGADLVKKVLYELGKYYLHTDDKCLSHKDYIDKNFDELKFDLDNNVTYYDSHNYLFIDDNVLIEFFNGVIIYIIDGVHFIKKKED